VYRCYVVGGVYLVGKNSTKEARRSVLNWLVAGKGHEFGAWLAEPPAETDVLAGWQALAAQSNGSITLEPLPVIEAREPLVNPRGSEHALAARASRRLLRDRWRMASFSSLIAAGARDESNQPQPADARPDHDELVDAIDALQAGATPPREKAVLADDDILAFPRGPAAGECLHRMYELADFTAPETWPKAIDRALREHPTPAPEAIARHLPSMMLRLVADTVATELVPGMRLASIGPKRRMNELEFLFPAQALDFAALRRLLAAHGFPDVALEAGTLRGFVKGFIDMIVEHDGRFWIIDWKSNHLGDTPADYDAASLDEAMASHAYHLQALFYVVALHRYLRSRLAGYAYQTHIGGYLYLFVRGVRPGWLDGTRAAGVHAALPGRELVEALDRLMSGGTA
jgi:exodeoxyribonuclease V beta subunit